MNRFLYVAAALALAAVAPRAAATLDVVTTTEDLAALARAVGGDQVRVESLTPGTRDPHFAVAKPSMIRRVYGADLLLVIGADLEIGWLPALLRSARNGRVQPGQPGYLDLSQSVPLLDVRDGPVSRALGDVHARGNPHYWLDPRNGARMAAAIAARLAQLDPANADAYAARSQALGVELEHRYADWRAALAPLVGEPVIAYHTSFIYLADAFGFDIVDEVEPKPGIAASAASLGELVAHIEASGAGLLIMEPFYERRSARYLAERTGIRVVVLPQSVGALPGIETYTELFDAIVARLAGAGER